MAKKKTLGKLKQDLQKLVNKYVRLRDSEGGYFTCVACRKTLPIDQMNAGHFYPVKNYDALRFDLDNIHGECIRCNCFDEMHLLGYFNGIHERIGKKRFNALKQRADDYKKYGNKFNRTDIEELIEEFKQKIKEFD